MRTKNIIILLLLIFSLHGCDKFRQDEIKYSREVEEKIAQVEHNLSGWVQIQDTPNKWTLEERMKFYHVHGVSIAVINDYQVEWAKGYGWADSASQKPVTTKTLFLAGSISKSLNSVGVLKLVQEGKLDLETDINTYLKSWQFPYDSLSKGKKITIANLLSHTAGLTVHGFPGYEVGTPIPTLVQILNGEKPANTKAVRSMYAPSLQYEYSGGGTTISQLIVEDVTGKPYDEYMAENVLKPLGMHLSSYTQPPSGEMRNLLATGYYNDGKPVKGNYHLYPEQAAAGLWSNPTDLANYVIETQLALTGESQRVLSKEMTLRRLTPYVDSLSALGAFIMNRKGVKYFSHRGTDEGFVSLYFGSFEKGNGVVVMSNTYNGALNNEIINSVATVYNWQNFYSPVIKKEVKLSDRELEKYVGKYQITNDTVSIIRKGDGLYLNENQKRFHFSDSTHAFMVEEKIEFDFQLDKSQKVIGFSANNQTARKIE